MRRAVVDQRDRVSGQRVAVELMAGFDLPGRAIREQVADPLGLDPLRAAAGIDKGAMTPKRESVGRVTRDQVREIAGIKMADLNANDLDAGAGA